MDRPATEILRTEAAQRFRDPPNWRAEALRLHRETTLSVVEIGKRVGVGKNRVGKLVRGCKRGLTMPGTRPATAATAANAQRKRHAGVVRVGNTMVRKVARVISQSDRESGSDPRRERLHRMLLADQGHRDVPPVTLPRVSILEGVEP